MEAAIEKALDARFSAMEDKLASLSNQNEKLGLDLVEKLLSANQSNEAIVKASIQRFEKSWSECIELQNDVKAKLLSLEQQQKEILSVQDDTKAKVKSLEDAMQSHLSGLDELQKNQIDLKNLSPSLQQLQSSLQLVLTGESEANAHSEALLESVNKINHKCDQLIVDQAANHDTVAKTLAETVKKEIWALKNEKSIKNNQVCLDAKVEELSEAVGKVKDQVDTIVEATTKSIPQDLALTKDEVASSKSEVMKNIAKLKDLVPLSKDKAIKVETANHYANEGLDELLNKKLGEFGEVVERIAADQAKQETIHYQETLDKFTDIKREVANYHETGIQIVNVLQRIEDLLMAGCSISKVDEMLPKLDSLVIKLYAVVNETKEKPSISDKTGGDQLQKILTILEGIKEATTSDSTQEKSETNSSSQIINTLSDIKSLISGKEEINFKLLTDLKSQLTKSLNTEAISCKSDGTEANGVEFMAQTKSLLTQVQASVEEIHEKVLTPIKVNATSSSESVREDTLSTLLSGFEQKILSELAKEHKALAKKLQLQQSSPSLPTTPASNLSHLLDKLEETESKILTSLEENSSKTMEEFNRQNGVSFEILNSVEDLKQLTSSMPNALHDIAPKIETIAKYTNEIPNDIGALVAAMEENLCANLESRIRDVNDGTLSQVLERFEVMEQRLAVIKKYAKHGPTGGDRGSLPDSEPSPAPSNTTTSVVNVSGDNLSDLIKSEINVAIEKNVGKISFANINELREGIKKVNVNCGRIVDDMVRRGNMMEEQFEALADTILQPIRDLKPDQEKIVNLLKAELKGGLVPRGPPTPDTAAGGRRVHNYLLPSHLSKLESNLAGPLAQCINLVCDLKNAQEEGLRKLMVQARLGTDSTPAQDKTWEMLVQSLVDHLKRVQLAQHDILRQTNEVMSHEEKAVKIYTSLVSNMAAIQKHLESRFDRKLDCGTRLPKLLRTLENHVSDIADVQRDMRDCKTTCIQDVKDLMQMCFQILDQVASSKSFNPLQPTKLNRKRPLPGGQGQGRPRLGPKCRIQHRDQDETSESHADTNLIDGSDEDHDDHDQSRAMKKKKQEVTQSPVVNLSRVKVPMTSSTFAEHRGTTQTLALSPSSSTSESDNDQASSNQSST